MSAGFFRFFTIFLLIFTVTKANVQKYPAKPKPTTTKGYPTIKIISIKGYPTSKTTIGKDYPTTTMSNTKGSPTTTIPGT